MCKKRVLVELYRSISPYSVRMRENADQNNSEYGHFYAVLTVNLICILLLIHIDFTEIGFSYIIIIYYRRVYGNLHIVKM